MPSKIYNLLQSSQISSCSVEEGRDPLVDINKALSLISEGRLIIKHQVRCPISNLHESTLRLLKRTANEAIDALLNGLAPGQGPELLSIIEADRTKTVNSEDYL